jgi:hypothetical protein
MGRRIIWAAGLSALVAGYATAQQPGPGPGAGFYPAAPGPVLSLPSNVLFPDPVPPPTGMPGSGFAEKPPRYPVDESGNRAINWFYSQSELLYGWVNKGDSRPLGTRGNALGRGVLGEPGTSSLGATDDFDSAYGFRQMIGIWLVPSRKFGFETGGYVLERQTAGFTATSDGSAILARPFYDASTDSENARLIAFPDGFRGTVSALGTTRNYGLEANFIFNAMERDAFSLDFLTGFRFLALEENLTVRDRTQAFNAGLVAYNGVLAGNPAAVAVTDRAATANRFYGMALGLRASGEYTRISYSLTTKISLGGVRQRQFTEGRTDFFPDGVTLGNSTPTGMLYYTNNSGLQNRTKFAVVPELGLKLGYRITNRISSYIGYDVIYLNDAIRPSDTVSRSINPTLLPTSPTFGVPFGPNVPTAGIRTSDFLLQTFSSGVMVVF